MDCKGAKDDGKPDEPTSGEHINLKQSAEIMEVYLKEEELNPEVIVMYKGFLCIFSAWIINESLPWTAGEVLTLQMLFRYLKIIYQLPSDSTICNQLAHIFKELHGKVVHEFAVHFFLEAGTISHSLSRQSNPRLPMQLIHGQHCKWCIHSRAQSGVLSMMTGK